MSGKAALVGSFPLKPGLSSSMIVRQCDHQMLRWSSVTGSLNCRTASCRWLRISRSRFSPPPIAWRMPLPKWPYLQAGTPLVWLVNPVTRTVVDFRAEMDPLTLSESDTLDGGDVLP